MEERQKRHPKKKSMLVYYDILPQLELLTDEQAGELFKVMLKYDAYGENPIGLDGLTLMMFVGIKQTLDRDMKKYKASVENGKKGGAPKGNSNARKQKEDKFDVFGSFLDEE